MELSFWYKNPTGGDFSVYISTDGGDTYGTALITDLTEATKWREQSVSLADYAGQEVVIVFKGTSNDGKQFPNILLLFERVYCDTYTIMRQIKGNGLIFVAFLYLNDTTFRNYSYLCSGINNNKLKTRDYG